VNNASADVLSSSRNSSHKKTTNPVKQNLPQAEVKTYEVTVIHLHPKTTLLNNPVPTLLIKQPQNLLPRKRLTKTLIRRI
jgi:hypothetical protein